MAGVHLTAELWRNLLRGESFDGREGLVRHLSDPCEPCEAVIAEAGVADELDGEIDAVLGDLRPASVPAGNDVEFERIWRQVRRRPLLPALAAAAAAAVVVVTAGLLLRSVPSRDHGGGLKGPETIGEVEVSFAIARRVMGAAPRLEKGVPGHWYSPDQDVLIRYRIDEPGFVSVVRSGPDGSTEIIVDEQRTMPGEHDVEVSGRPAGYPLAGLAGVQHFAVMVSRQSMSEAELQALAQQFLRSGASARLGAEVSLASFAIQVGAEPRP
jgi:hypothetical protein